MEFKYLFFNFSSGLDSEHTLGEASAKLSSKEKSFY